MDTPQATKLHRVGLVTLMYAAEGCAESLKNGAVLDQLLPIVLGAARGVADPSVSVRSAACMCLGEWSGHLQPEILGYHKSILLPVFELLSDPAYAVRTSACFVLERFCEPVGSRIQIVALRRFNLHAKRI